MNVLVFDIETVPDIKGAESIWDVNGLSESDVKSFLSTSRLQETSGRTDFLKHHLHKIVSISVAVRNKTTFKLWSLGEESSNEKELLERFFLGIKKYEPTLVSWNGNGFDLPVIHYRSLIHEVSSSLYWEVGFDRKEFRFNNYQSRYHNRHLDLMDILSGYNPGAYVRLDQIASMCGFPGKMGLSGGDVSEKYSKGQISDIRDYCETDVLNTWLVYLKFELMRGNLHRLEYEKEINITLEFLKTVNASHFDEFQKALE